MTLRFTFLSAVATAIVILTSGCKTREKMVYFQNQNAEIINGLKNYTPAFKPDDLLQVVVTSSNPEAAIPFNVPKELIRQGGANMPTYANGMAIQLGYLVDEEGYVDLPVIGRFKFGGKTRSQAIAELTKIYEQYFPYPVVNIQIQNFKVTVLGDVNMPGSFNIPNERITLIEALGIAGDLKITGNRKNILVIRDNNGQKEEFRVDITNTAFMASPVYFLQQNDVVYVEPNLAARSQGTFLRSNSSTIISSITLVLLILRDLSI
jgi:polysaccharide export outer membrane protein